MPVDDTVRRRFLSDEELAALKRNPVEREAPPQGEQVAAEAVAEALDAIEPDMDAMRGIMETLDNVSGDLRILRVRLAALNALHARAETIRANAVYNEYVAQSLYDVAMGAASKATKKAVLDNCLRHRQLAAGHVNAINRWRKSVNLRIQRHPDTQA